MQFDLKDIAADPDAVDELVNTYKSRSTPTIVVGNEVLIGFGTDVQTKLKALLNLK